MSPLALIDLYVVMIISICDKKIMMWTDAEKGVHRRKLNWLS